MIHNDLYDYQISGNSITGLFSPMESVGQSGSLYAIAITCVSVTLSSSEDNFIEKNIIKNLLRTNHYLNDYIAYLLGSYSDKEFKRISKNHAKTYDDENISDD